jgi:transcriptional regulator with XRE-family HTH domain
VGVSLKDIAKRAEVSLATVSNVVNGYRPVSDETRQRVQEAIDELGYTPNLSARHLRHGRTGIIALAIPELTNPYFAELAGAAIHEARQHGYTLLMDYTDGDRDTELMLLQGFRERIIDGLVLSPVQLERKDVLARTSGVPLVLIGESVYDVQHDHIAIDNRVAGPAGRGVRLQRPHRDRRHARDPPGGPAHPGGHRGHRLRRHRGRTVQQSNPHHHLAGQGAHRRAGGAFADRPRRGQASRPASRHAATIPAGHSAEHARPAVAGFRVHRKHDARGRLDQHTYLTVRRPP